MKPKETHMKLIRFTEKERQIFNDKYGVHAESVARFIQRHQGSGRKNGDVLDKTQRAVEALISFAKILPDPAPIHELIEKVLSL